MFERSLGVLLAAGIGIAAIGAQTPATASWTGREAAVEESLRTSRIDRIEMVPIGVTAPRRAFFSPGNPFASAAWKPLRPGMRNGYWESYKSEIAAYELDKLLGMHMVPPAVEREIEGQKGAVVLWLDGVKGWSNQKPVHGPEPLWSRQISRMKLFDQLTANIDRNQGNLLYDDEWHLFLIDHSRAFTPRTSLSGIAPLQRIDQTLWERIEAITRPDLDRALGPWLDAPAIDAIVKRRDKIREEVRARVTRLGEAAVFLK